MLLLKGNLKSNWGLASKLRCKQKIRIKYFAFLLAVPKSSKL